MPDFTVPGKYIESHYKPDDWLAAVLLYRDAEGRTVSVKHEFAGAEDMASDRRQAHFRAANANGADIYVGVNSFHQGTRNRTKADVKAVRHLYLDVDENGPAVLESVTNAKDLPKPSTVLASSPGKLQILWKVDGFTPDQAEAAVRGLAAQHGADEAVWDCARILRLAGYRNQKYPAIKAWVQEIPGERSQGILTPADFPAFPVIERQIARDGRKIAAGHSSASEKDWGRTLRKLESGEDAGSVEAWLRAEGEEKAPEYAARTVANALRYLQQKPAKTHCHKR